MADIHGHFLRICREKLGSPPREMEREAREPFNIRLSFLTRAYLLAFGDKLRRILHEQNCLRDQGADRLGSSRTGKRCPVQSKESANTAREPDLQPG